MKEILVSLGDVKKYSFNEQIELFRNHCVRLPKGVYAEFIGSGVSCTYYSEEDNSLIHTLPVVGKIVEFVRVKQFPEAPRVD